MESPRPVPERREPEPSEARSAGGDGSGVSNGHRPSDTGIWSEPPPRRNGCGAGNAETSEPSRNQRYPDGFRRVLRPGPGQHRVTTNHQGTADAATAAADDGDMDERGTRLWPQWWRGVSGAVEVCECSRFLQARLQPPQSVAFPGGVPPRGGWGRQTGAHTHACRHKQTRTDRSSVSVLFPHQAKPAVAHQRASDHSSFCATVFALRHFLSRQTFYCVPLEE